MATDNPLISIVMAVYKPDLQWLREQLESLNHQTYPNLELLICDDCPESPVDDKNFSEIIKNFPFQVFRNEKNLGSNKTFEKLTDLAKGKYISYCDQDDIWHSNKIEKMASVLEKTGSPLVCSDRNIIDARGRIIADSITKISRRNVFYEGENLAPKLLVSNFVTGCAMMMKAEVAKKSIPFVDSLYHDQWLAINAALNGRIEVIRESLLDYRQHENNQTGILRGVTDKATYYDERLIKFMPRLEDYKNRLYFGEMKKVIDELEAFYKARIRYSKKVNHGDLKIMIKYKNYASNSVFIEMFMKLIPNWTFKKMISLAKKGVI